MWPVFRTPFCATRAATLAPGQRIRVEVIEDKPPRDLARFPLVKDRLP